MSTQGYDLLKLTPYPLIDTQGNIYKGTLLEENQICQLCENKECIKSRNIKDFSLQSCTNNILYFKITIHGDVYFVHGLQNDYHELPRKEKKKISNGIYFRNIPTVKRWAARANEMLSDIEQNLTAAQSKTESNNSIFIHDMKKVYSTILRKMENYVSENCDDLQNYDNCIKNLNPHLLGVYKSINLLEHQFSIVDYIANPESISYGQNEPIRVYRAIDKLVKIFQTISKNRIFITGQSHNELFLRQSFMTLMFILIDNAIKYSLKDQNITVNVQDYYDEIEIAVTSYSPFISSKSKKLIFEKHYRDEVAKYITPDGQGIGLYLAKKIADVLDSKINVSCSPNKHSIDDIYYCEVQFSLKLKSLD